MFRSRHLVIQIAAFGILLFSAATSFAGAKYTFIFHNIGSTPLTLEAINQVNKVGHPDTYSTCMGDNWLTPPPSSPVTIAPNDTYGVDDVTDKNTGSCGDEMKVNTWRISSASDHSQFVNAQFVHQDSEGGDNPDSPDWVTQVREYYGGGINAKTPNPSKAPPKLTDAFCDGTSCLNYLALQKGNSQVDMYFSNP